MRADAPRATIIDTAARTIGRSAATRVPSAASNITTAMGAPNISPCFSPSLASFRKSVLADA